MNPGRRPFREPTIADDIMADKTLHEFNAVAEVNCKCLDASTRKVMLFLINERLKTLKTFPRGLMDDLEYDLLELKEQLLECSMRKKKKPADGKP